MSLFRNFILEKNKMKSRKTRPNSKNTLKKNKTLTYYHFDGQPNYINRRSKNKIEENKLQSKTNNSKTFSNNYYVNEHYLLNAYKKSVIELFKTIKKYFAKELSKYENIKKDFMSNLQKIYEEEKIKSKSPPKNTYSNIHNNINNYKNNNVSYPFVRNTDLKKHYVNYSTLLKKPNYNCIKYRRKRYK